MADTDFYRSPLGGRYASEAMRSVFSERHRFETWRRLWVELAAAQHALDLGVRAEQVAALREHVQMREADFDVATQREREVRHDVMAHVHAFGEAVPAAKGIIHLGMTSCDITDNAELILVRDGFEILHGRLVQLVRQLADFAEQTRSLPTLGFTHYQPAMPTTVGKRAATWLQEFWWAAQRLETVREELPLRGLKGATGTQASFLALCNGDAAKVEELERRWATALGFERVVPITGQTYPRTLDAMILEPLSLLADAAAKFANDLRLLANLRELEEPFGKQQVGSSAMPFKRNPMRCERINALCRSLVHLVPNAHATAQAQWLERTLDDSANRRITLAESFLLADAILLLAVDVTGGMVVNEAVIRANLERELPFLAAEPILMAAVQQAGGDRQELHERLRRYTHEAVTELKAGKPHALEEKLRGDATFGTLDLEALLDPGNPVHIGRAPQQVEEFLQATIRPWLAERTNVAPPDGDVRV